jgi:signal transduction histidine kinase
LLAQDLEAGLFLVEPDGTVSFATPRALTFLGIREPAGNGHRPGLEGGNAIAREIAARIPATNGPTATVRREYLRLGQDGDRYLSVTLSPIRSRPGSGQWAILVEDVTGIVTCGRETSQWARNLVHDLKSPLSTVAGSIDLIFSGRLGEVDPKLQNFLNLIQKGVDRLIEMLGTAGKTRPSGAPEARVVEDGPPTPGKEVPDGKADPHRR